MPKAPDSKRTLKVDLAGMKIAMFVDDMSDIVKFEWFKHVKTWQTVPNSTQKDRVNHRTAFNLLVKHPLPITVFPGPISGVLI